LQLLIGLCLVAKSLYRCENVSLLRRKGVAELLQPGQIVVHGHQYDWKRHQGLHTRIPWFGFESLRQCIA
jgi:hypothetical protein